MHIIWAYIFVIYLEYGIIGTGISNVITNAIILVSLLVATRNMDQFKTLKGPDNRIFEDLG